MSQEINIKFNKPVKSVSFKMPDEKRLTELENRESAIKQALSEYHAEKLSGFGLAGRIEEILGEK